MSVWSLGCYSCLVGATLVYDVRLIVVCVVNWMQLLPGGCYSCVLIGCRDVFLKVAFGLTGKVVAMEGAVATALNHHPDV